MEAVAPETNSPFNGPVETGMRAVLCLHASFPKELDIQRLTALDYLLVRTSLLGGPPDIHPSTPIMTPVTQVRRKAVSESLDLMMSRELVERSITEKGIFYRAGEYSSFFVDALCTSYSEQLRYRANWIADYFATYSDDAFEDHMRSLLSDWVSEFQDETKGGL
ncbi:ABC-three component system middle component 2 [Thalassobius sp. MITS945101]|uniref:ABC-three component system middle component 2 n=1 Tax=Thalassobius sp. MITS945101 TaxID=3096994 RepID=UPI00399B0028